MKAILFVLVFAMWLSACCPQRKEPPPPKDAMGWKDFQEGTTKLRGRFLLKKGESTDNGKVEIEVLELIPPDCPSEVGSFERQARVKLQFRGLSNSQNLCSDVFPEHGGAELIGPCDSIADEYDIWGVGVGAINLKEGWVYFELIGTYEDPN
jgi:hypothetical protein